jgi:hypothetical protein
METIRSDAGHANVMMGHGVCGVGLTRQLLEFEPQGQRRQPEAGDPLKILHLLSQQPGKTGSGVVLLSLVRLDADEGYRQRAVIGLPGAEPLPDVPPLPPADLFPVRFDRPPVPFAIPGMSDIMPYKSTRFSSFTPEMLDG